MPSCTQIATIVQALADKHGLDLTRPGQWITLDAGYGLEPLTISCEGPHLVSVAHYFAQNSEQVPDPSFLFYTAGEEWQPIEYTLVSGYYCQCASIREGRYLPYNAHDVAEAAAFTECWADNLEAFGWIERGQVVERA